MMIRRKIVIMFAIFISSIAFNGNVAQNKNENIKEMKIMYVNKDHQILVNFLYKDGSEDQIWLSTLEYARLPIIDTPK